MTQSNESNETMRLLLQIKILRTAARKKHIMFFFRAAFVPRILNYNLTQCDAVECSVKCTTKNELTYLIQTNHIQYEVTTVSDRE